MLILFDIDQTLLAVRGAGMRALRDAGSSLFARRFETETVDYAGRLDPLIMHDLLVHNGVEPTPEHHAAMRSAYAEAFARELSAMAADHEAPPLALPGAIDLVSRLATRQELVLGVLTGNYEETGAAKLSAAGFAIDHFRVRIWGDHSPHTPPHRDHLPPIALEFWRSIDRDRAHPGRAVIVGDTRHDVRCAKQNGMRCLAVATGFTPAEQLADAGADLVLDTLSDTDRIESWLMDA